MLAIGLFYLALRGISLAEIFGALKQASYGWILPLIAVTIASHLVRAWRWQQLLRTLQDEPHVPLMTAFSGLMIGYMVNYALPRVGELARSAHVASQAGLRVSAVVGTVVVERLIDVAALLLGLALSGILLLGKAAVVRESILAPAARTLADMQGMLVAAVVLGTALVAFGAYVLRNRKRFLGKRLTPLWESFTEGLLSAKRSARKTGLAASTLVMFLLYVCMAYIPLVMFGIAGPYGLSLIDGMVIMFIGTVGVAIPTPGGIGSFHYITRISLVSLFGVPATLAVTYAVFLHGMQLVLYAFIGLLAVLFRNEKVGQLPVRARKPR